MVTEVQTPPVLISDSVAVEMELPEGNDVQEALGLGMEVLKAIKAGRMQLVLGLLLMILIWTLRTFWSSFHSTAVPWLTAGIAILGSAAVGLLSGWPWERILTDALTISTSAGGLWSLIGKHISNLNFGKK
jgi:multidrug efflux pump subunit AcrB